MTLKLIVGFSFSSTFLYCRPISSRFHFVDPLLSTFHFVDLLLSTFSFSTFYSVNISFVNFCDYICVNVFISFTQLIFFTLICGVGLFFVELLVVCRPSRARSGRRRRWRRRSDRSHESLPLPASRHKISLLNFFSFLLPFSSFLFRNLKFVFPVSTGVSKRHNAGCI
jgi:hypothetical protein